MRGFDELRFGRERTLNLRESLPTAAEAVWRAELWLREQQIRGSKEVLLITGRGLHSIGGVGVIRAAIEKLLFSLRRRGIVATHQEHNPGAFAVQLAPLKSLMEAPARRRERTPARPRLEVPGLAAETRRLLRHLAEASLAQLGVQPDEHGLSDEMHRHLGLLVPSLPPGPRMEEHLRAALHAAIAEYE